MEVQRPAHAQNANNDRDRALEERTQPLFTCQIRDDTSTPAEAICHACLHALDRLAEDAFYTADAASQQFASGKLRPVGRRLDGLRLRLQIWMLDVGLDTTGVTSVPQSPNDYFERAAGGKIRTISRCCKTVASCLRGMCEDFHVMASDLNTAGRARVNSIISNGERINETLDELESMIHSLTGLVNPILMARALRTGTGQYSEVQKRVHTIMDRGRPSDASYASQRGSNANMMEEDHLSSSSGDSVFEIHPASPEDDRPGTRNSQMVPEVNEIQFGRSTSTDQAAVEHPPCSFEPPSRVRPPNPDSVKEPDLPDDALFEWIPGRVNWYVRLKHKFFGVFASMYYSGACCVGCCECQCCARGENVDNAEYGHSLGQYR